MSITIDCWMSAAFNTESAQKAVFLISQKGIEV